MPALWMCASPCVTEAGLWFGENAQCFGEWQPRFGRVGFWGKPVFQLTVSSQLAESLAWGAGAILRDGTSTQAETRPGFAEC